MKQIIVTGEYREIAEQFILLILPSLSWMCESMHCLHDRALSASSYADFSKLNYESLSVAVFGRLENMAPILHKAFSYANVYVKYSSHILLLYLWCLSSPLILICSNLNNMVIYYFFVLIDNSIACSEHATSLVLVMPRLNSVNHPQEVVLIE